MIAAPRCSCGGRLKSAAVERPGLEALFGLKGRFEGKVAGLRCDACGGETFDGHVFDRMFRAVALNVLAQPRILSEEEARFLRKALLQMTQDDLAERMGINKVTVSDWERGDRPLSKEHDYELRGIALAALLQQHPLGERLGALLERVLLAPRRVGPPARSKPYRIPVAELAEE